MSWLSNFFNPGKEEREELTTLYNEAYDADLNTDAMEGLEQQLTKQGYKVAWNSVTEQFELVDD
jgi:hypothetical protein